MFSFLFGKKNARKTSSRPLLPGYRPQCEALEDRLVMTTLATAASVATSPVVTTTAVTFNNPFASLPSAQAVNLTVEPRDLLAGSLSGPKTTQLFSFELQQNDYLQSEVTLPISLPGAHATAQMSILNSNGTVLNTSNVNTPYGFYAPATGTYYAEVTGSVTSSSFLVPAVAGYELELHRLALAQGTQSVATLAETGSMYAFLQGNTLDITGPTGYGFGITGNWKQTFAGGANRIADTIALGAVAGQTGQTVSPAPVSSIYTATGNIVLDTAAGPISLGLANGVSFVVTTAPQINGQIFGVVSTMTASASINTASLTSFVGNELGFNLSALAETIPVNISLGGAAGIGLGNSAELQKTGAPVNNAIPYIYFSNSSLSVVADPADPALYVEGSLLGKVPLGPVSVTGLAFSEHGLIPYTPVDAPSQSTSTMHSGNLLLQGTINTTALTAPIPSQIVGSITMNFDPNNTGSYFGGADFTAAQVTDALAGNSAALDQNINTVLHNVSVGVNGTLNMNPFAALTSNTSNTADSSTFDPNAASVTAAKGTLSSENAASNMLAFGHASLIYDGPTGSLYFRGSSTDPFAGTSFAKLVPVYNFAAETGTVPTFDVDGAIRPGGEFFLDASGTYNIVGLPASGEILIARDFAVTGPAIHFLTPDQPNSGGAPTYTGIYFDANVALLGNKVDLQGTMAGNGDFTLSADADLNLGALTGTALFTLSDTHAAGFSFDAEMKTDFTIKNVGYGDMTIDFGFGVSPAGAVSVAGSFNADCYVDTYIDGWQGFDVNGVFNNGYISFSVDDIGVSFKL